MKSQVGFDFAEICSAHLLYYSHFNKKRGVFVEGLSEWAVRSPMEIYTLMKKGANSRATASTKMNDLSSRSHAVFIITVEQM